nr:glyoxalase I {EC 4.4.1.5} [Saccharomyces cerevisiae=yeast, Peptide Partial, 7 aa] [Saccharomyces cerevisiae]
FYTEHFG